jgi:dihydrofolate reductase
MRKLIAAMNLTLDGYCDHTSMIADDEIHEHYTGLLRSADTVIYGRITYQLMEYWQTVVKNPTGNKADDEFAAAIDNISKVVFSHTLKNADTKIIGWKNTRVAKRSIEEEVSELRQSRPASSGSGSKNILVGSPGLIIQCMNLNLIDEYQFSVQPTIAGKGLPLFQNIKARMDLKLIKTKTFGCGAVTFYYEPKRK